MREVSQAALGGFTEVWDSMEEAGYLVLTSARDNTAAVVEHRRAMHAGVGEGGGNEGRGRSGAAPHVANLAGNPGPRVVCRYGAEAGATSVEGMNAAGYAGDAFLASRRIGVRTVAKSAAKHTARVSGQGG